jgi:hypothetical protein
VRLEFARANGQPHSRLAARVSGINESD